MPLINYTISDALLETVPDIDQPLLQFIGVMNFRLVDSLLHFSLNVVVNRVQIWAVWEPSLVK